jgi:AraC-like DNA-binding protein
MRKIVWTDAKDRLDGYQGDRWGGGRRSSDENRFCAEKRFLNLNEIEQKEGIGSLRPRTAGRALARAAVRTYVQTGEEFRSGSMNGQSSAWAPQRFSTDGFVERDRRAVLYDIYARTIVEADVESWEDGPAQFEATRYALPGIAVAAIAHSGLRMRRPRSLRDPDQLVFGVGLTGCRGSVSEAGREVSFASGEAFLCTGGAAEAVVLPGSQALVLTMTKTALAPLVADVDAMLLRRIPAEIPALRMLIGYSRVLQDTQSLSAPELRHSIATHFCDLVALALGATRDATEMARGRGARAARLRAIKADIAANLDGKLSVASLAARHRMTPRLIQMLFEAEGTTCTEYILVQRLARAHRMLADPLRAGEKIAEIAFEAGFGDLSYFNRAFRRRYGIVPSDARAASQVTATA